MDRRSVGKWTIVGLTALLLASLLLAGCTTTATIKVTVKGEDGAALKDITVAVSDKTAKTDASGVATVKGITPGQVTLKFTGNNYDEQKIETVKAGSNEFSYQLQSHAWEPREFADVAKMRMRVTEVGMDDPVTGEFVRGQGAHWTLPDGSELIHLGDRAYFKVPGKGWRQLTMGGAPEATGEMIAQLTSQFLGQFQAFDAHTTGSLTQAKWLGNEEANGYQCKVYEVTWAEGGAGGTYKVWVVRSGDYRGYVTRHQWTVENLGTSVYDAYDFGAELMVQAPL